MRSICILLLVTLFCSCAGRKEETREPAGTAPDASYAAAEVEGLVKKTVTTRNNTDTRQFLAREVPYLLDEDGTVHYYTSESPAPLINDLFFRAAALSGGVYAFYNTPSNPFPHSPYNPDGGAGYDGVTSAFRHMAVFSPDYPPPVEQLKLLFNGGTFNIFDVYNLFQSFTPAGMRDEVVYTTETVTGEYRSDDFTLPLNAAYDIPPDYACNRTVPVTLYTHFCVSPDIFSSSFTLLKTLHYYETLDIHVTEQYESMNRAVYKTVTAFIDSALSVTDIRASASVKDFIREGNKITFTLNDYANPAKFEIARIAVRDETAGTARMKILQLK